VRPEHREALSGEIPSPVSPPSGCRFRTRCPRAEDKCAVEVPEVRRFGDGQFVACHFPLSPTDTVTPTDILAAN
jgi:peptide/nickel transport system ATP-binding protein